MYHWFMKITFIVLGVQGVHLPQEFSSLTFVEPQDEWYIKKIQKALVFLLNDWTYGFCWTNSARKRRNKLVGMEIDRQKRKEQSGI